MLRRRTQQLIKREGFGAQRIICRRTGVNPSSLCQWLRGNLESSKVEQAMEGLLAELAASGEGLGLANLGGDGSRALAASSKGKTVLKRMRELIKAEGYGAQRKVVRMSGINQSSLCQWLKGNFSTPRVEQAMEKLLAEVAAGKGLSPAPPPARAVRAPKRPPASKPARASRTISKRAKSSSRVAATAASAAAAAAPNAGGATQQGWTSAEDTKLRKLVQRHGAAAWATKAKQLGGRRTGAAVRSRWQMHLRPNAPFAATPRSHGATAKSTAIRPSSGATRASATKTKATTDTPAASASTDGSHSRGCSYLPPASFFAEDGEEELTTAVAVVVEPAAAAAAAAAPPTRGNKSGDDRPSASASAAGSASSAAAAPLAREWHALPKKVKEILLSQPEAAEPTGPHSGTCSFVQRADGAQLPPLPPPPQAARGGAAAAANATSKGKHADASDSESEDSESEDPEAEAEAEEAEVEEEEEWTELHEAWKQLVLASARKMKRSEKNLWRYVGKAEIGLQLAALRDNAAANRIIGWSKDTRGRKAGTKNACLLRHFILKLINLPRQARDKHRGTHKRDAFFAGCLKASDSRELAAIMRTALNKLGDNAGAKAALNAVMHALTSSGSTADDRQAAAGAGADQPSGPMNHDVKAPSPPPPEEEEAEDTFAAGEVVECPGCLKHMRAPIQALALRCASCRAEIYPECRFATIYPKGRGKQPQKSTRRIDRNYCELHNNRPISY